MISLHIPEISSTAGELSDGVFVGVIRQVNPVAVLLGETLVPLSQVIRKAVTVTGATWQDFTVEAMSAATGSVGGIGYSSNITGTAVSYAGGGGGSGTSSGSAGSNGGGAGSSTATGGNGGVNTGGGGGGGITPGTGGSGMVIIRFATQSRIYQALASYISNAAAKTAGLLVGQFFLNSGNVQQVV